MNEAKQPLQETEIRTLIEQAKKESHLFRSKRDAALMELVYHTGMKLDDVLSLKFGDVRSDVRAVDIGTGNIRRTLMLDDEIAAILIDYLGVLVKRKKGAPLTYDDAIFPSATGSPKQGMTRQAIHAMMQDYARKAKIRKTVNLTLIRDAYAARCIKNGMGHSELQRQLGLNTKASLGKYLANVDNN